MILQLDFSCFSLIYYRKEKMINIKGNLMKKYTNFNLNGK